MKHWFKSLFRRSGEYVVDLSSDQAFDVFPRNRSSAGIPVTRDTVFGLPAFYRGVNLIASTVARTPCHVYRRGDNNNKERATDHPAYRLLRKQPNPNQTAFALHRQLVTNALWAGNGYVWVERAPDATPLGLYLLDPDVTYPVVVHTGLTQDLYYVTTVQGKQFTLRPDEVVHVRGLGISTGLVGMRLVDVLKENLGLSLGVQKYGATYFRNNGSITNVILVDKPFANAEQVATFRAGLEEKHVGMDQNFKTILLQGGATFQRVPVSNEEAQFLQSRQMTLVDVANILNISASRLNGQVATSYSSIEAQNLADLSDCFDAWFVNIEQELENKLLREDEKQEDSVFIEYMREALTRADTRTEVDTIINQLNNGLLSWQEARAIRGHSTERDPDQEFRRPSNIQIEGEEPPAPPAPPQAPPVPAPGSEPEPQAQGDKTQERAFKGLLKATVERLVTRLQKDPQADLERHRGIVEASLPGLSTAWLDRLAQELDEVLPEQRALAMQRLNTETIVEDIWNDVL